MKKRFLGLALVLTAFAANAQTEGAVTLSVKLKPLQTIMIQGSTVNLDYTDKNHYAQGVKAAIDNHLKVYSTGGFEIYVRSADDTKTNGTNSINFNDITVEAANGSSPLSDAPTYKTVNLATAANSADNMLVKSEVGGVDKTFKVTYSAPNADKYILDGSVGTTEKTYTTTVTYEIVAS